MIRNLRWYSLFAWPLLLSCSSGKPAGSVPGAPPFILASAGDREAMVTWQAPTSDGGSPITSYTVTANPGGMTQKAFGMTATTVSGLTNGTSYTFTVYATNAVGDGPASAPSNAVVPMGSTAGHLATLTAPVETAYVGEPVLLKLTVKDGAGTPVPNLPIGLQVMDATSQLSHSHGNTDANGVFVATLASSQVGPVVVIAGTGSEELARRTETFNKPPTCAGTFKLNPLSVLPTGGVPSAVAAGDFDGDGNADLASAQQGSNAVEVLLGQGNTLFPTTKSFPVGQQPVSIVSGDFSNDGWTDLAVANQGDNTVSVLVGKGDGTFASAVSYPVGNQPAFVTSGDFNADGLLDLAVVSQDASVSVLLGKADGTLQSATSSAAGPGTPQTAIGGDFNQDKKLDLIVGDPAGGGLSLLAGNGDGTFQAPASLGVSAPVQSVTAADLNGDGILDVVAGTGQRSSVIVLLGTAEGQFQPPVEQTLSGRALGVISRDFDGDGKLDVVVTSDSSTFLLLGKGDGTFQPVRSYMAGGAPGAVVSLDVVDMGTSDLAVAFAQGLALVMAQCQ